METDFSEVYNYYKRPNLNWEVKVILRFVNNQIMPLKNDADVSKLKADGTARPQDEAKENSIEQRKTRIK
ncbi:hypothetical protein HAX54_046066 [Datura stramonium]|uniref:Uncharacterized protein n=1 Tax=Datura stramonium TaxID=4076 RepID=A0ABS8SR43_DATST|nr:hypothetical protein [Datura stramonium]